jgi:hypothetical protein
MEVLDLKFYSNDLYKDVTIREYFYCIMKSLWEQQEYFSGKRPLGNSDWDGDLIKCLIQNKLIKGKIDKDGYIDKYSYKELNNFVIDKIFKPLFGV